MTEQDGLLATLLTFVLEHVLILKANDARFSFKGDLDDEDELLKWLTSEDTLDIPDTIEQINQKMLSKLIENNDFVVVLFSTSTFALIQQSTYNIDSILIESQKTSNGYSVEYNTQNIFVHLNSQGQMPSVR